MRPLRLHLQAFGPFGQREEIDFTRLPPDALFLIHGPTGAGKTSLLDGICYALYGVTSGAERSGKEMRSQHAADTLRTEVSFEFRLGARRLRVSRSPEQERPAQRSGKDGQRGTVRLAAQAELAEWQADLWQPLASRTQEVSEHISRLLGFEADQFRQVIMLPQGRFRDFLAADSKSREQILETLFATDHYKAVQERLQATARQLENEARDTRNQRQAILQQAGVEDDAQLAERLRQGETSLVELRQQEAACRQQEEAARLALQAGEALLAAFTEAEQAEQALADLQQQQGSIDTLDHRLRQAQSAAQLQPLADARQTAASHLQGENNRLASIEASRHTAAQRCLLATQAYQAEQARQAERQAAQAELSQLQGLRPTIASLDALSRSVAQAERAARQSEQALQASTAQLKAWQAQQQAHQTACLQLGPLAARLDSLRQLQAELQRQQQWNTQLKQQQQRSQATRQATEQTSQQHQRAEQQLATAEAALQHAEQRWRADQAALLARHLQPGEACPVCGSQHHPQRAQAGQTTDDEPDLNALQTARDAARQALEQARLADQQAQLDAAKAQATLEALLAQAPETPAQPVDAALLARQLTEAEQAGPQLQAHQIALNTLAPRLEQQQLAVDSSRQSAEQSRQHWQTELARLNERQDSLPAALRTLQALDTACQQAQQRTEALEHALQQALDALRQAEIEQTAAQTAQQAAQQARDHAQQQWTASANALAEALRTSPFADEAAWQAALCDTATQQQMRDRLQAYALARAAAQARQQRAAQAIAGQQRPDLSQQQSAYAALRQQLEQLLQAGERQAQQSAQDQQTSATLARLDTSLGTLGERYAVLGQLAAVANGDNSQRLTFQRYVLAALLDDILRQASQRLASMSRGRYTLQRRLELGDARKAGGLELEVLDAFTGRCRPANTLSGGEGFMAALSLALGLSDVVQTYAGGIQLDTLFIDEGFGSLDQESLDTALQTLLTLRQQGRMIGIISHVEELKRQIDLGIEIRPVHAAASRIHLHGSGLRPAETA